MAKAGKVKTAAQTVVVPQSREEVAEAIAQIGQHTRTRARIEAAMGDELAAVRQRFEEQAEPHLVAISALLTGVQTWCEANRVSLTDGGKTKTGQFTSGAVWWRNTPPSVAIRSVETVLKALRERGLGRFVRMKEEVNKEAILAEPEAVKDVWGIRVHSTEEFVVVPFEAELAEAV